MGYLGNLMNRNRILILNDAQDCGASYTPLFNSFGDVCNDPASFKLNPYNFKLIVFTGGSDVTPELYGDTSPNSVCHCNSERDQMEKEVYNYGQQRGIKMVGICRGMQFLNVMTGGKLMHDISGHGHGDHRVMTKDINEPFLTNSYHHQMCIPHKTTHLLAWSHTKLSQRYIGNEDEAINYGGPEVEAIYMPWLKGIGVQWHPEADLDAESTDWFSHLVMDLLDTDGGMFKRVHLGIESAKMNIIEVKNG